jgi:hypothetical protein
MPRLAIESPDPQRHDSATDQGFLQSQLETVHNGSVENCLLIAKQC